MKNTTRMLIAAVMGGLAASAQADAVGERELAVCEAELKAYYGPKTEVKLVSRQRGLYGTQLKVAASQDGENAQFASCWVDSGDLAASDLEENVRRVVSLEPVSE